MFFRAFTRNNLQTAIFGSLHYCKLCKNSSSVNSGRVRTKSDSSNIISIDASNRIACRKKHCFSSSSSLSYVQSSRDDWDIKSQELTAINEQRQQQCHDLFGQPTSETHPHLVKQGELVPGFEGCEFRNRRDNFMERLISVTPYRYHLVIIPAASKSFMTEKIPFVFRQNSDFSYLTGCLEPDSVLVMYTSDTFSTSESFSTKNSNYSSTLFVRKRDAHSELWDGPRTGVERASHMFDVDQALPIEELKHYLDSHIESHPETIIWYDYLNKVQDDVHIIMKNMLNGPKQKAWESPRIHLHKMRSIKSPAEQRLMQESCCIASNAIARAMSVTSPGITEHQLFATVDYECRMSGAEILAYPPVVAAGSNATIIHYINNTQLTRKGDMVLMDAGCEYRGYVSDITRTWPVDGKFTPAQRILYDIVLELQKELIGLLHNMPSLDHLFHFMCKSLGHKLKVGGVFSSTVQNEKLAKLAYEFCPHHVSHYLGLDVHDTALVPRSIPLQHGMVVTVEPGVYISMNNKMARPEFRGYGVRIEDDVLVTDSGPVVLSGICPKEVEEIENLVGTQATSLSDRFLTKTSTNITMPPVS